MQEFTNVIKYVFKNYANFSGVIDRRTFWFWYLFTVIVSFGLQIFQSVLSLIGNFSLANSSGSMSAMLILSGISSLLSMAVSLGLAIPSLALQVRRLRDVGTNPLVLLGALVPLMVLIIGMVAGGVIGASTSSGSWQAMSNASVGVLLGMLPGLALSLGFGIWMLVLFCQPSKFRAQGNKYAIQ